MWPKGPQLYREKLLLPFHYINQHLLEKQPLVQNRYPVRKSDAFPILLNLPGKQEAAMQYCFGQILLDPADSLLLYNPVI